MLVGEQLGEWRPPRGCLGARVGCIPRGSRGPQHGHYPPAWENWPLSGHSAPGSTGDPWWPGLCQTRVVWPSTLGSRGHTGLFHSPGGPRGVIRLSVLRPGHSGSSRERDGGISHKVQGLPVRPISGQEQSPFAFSELFLPPGLFISRFYAELPSGPVDPSVRNSGGADSTPQQCC